MTTPAHDDEDGRLRTRPPETSAAGLRAVVEAGRHVARQAGALRGARTMLRVNQPDGFDCPGCAWPEPESPSRFEFCENGAKAVADEATLRRVDAEFFDSHTIADLAARSDYWLGQQGRLTEPVYRAPGDDRYRPIDWDDAFDLLAGQLRGLPDPGRAVFYTSGRTSNEAAFLYQLLVRAAGTNNLPDCSNMCHESSGVALKETIGAGKGSVTLDDIHHAELLVVVGQNPGTNHPRMLTALEKAKGNGATVVAINPLPEAGLLAFRNPQRLSGIVGRPTALADEFLQIRVGGDLALFQLVNRALIERGAIDVAFVEAYCDGFEALADHLAGVDTKALLDATGLTSSAVATLTDLLVTSERIIVCWAMGLTQHKAAVPTIREIVNTVLLRGAVGKPGAGLCPVRGHSNVQGDRTMGIHERPAPAFLAALGAEFGFTPPTRHGYSTVEAIRAMARGEVDVFVSMGGNFVAAAPDTNATSAAMARCRLTVSVSTKLNRSHVFGGEAALILPCLGRTEVDRAPDGREQFVTVEDSMSVVHASRGGLEPAGPQLRSEVAIVAELARRIPAVAAVADWESLAGNYDEVRARIEAVVPGFERFNQRARLPGGFTLPHPPRDSRTFPTASGRARLTVNEFEAIPVPEGRLLLQSVRSHDQYNTTIYGLDDRYRGVSGGRRVLFCHRDDITRLGFCDGEVIDIVSEWTDASERRAPSFRLVAYPVALGTCAAYFPEANVLVPLDSVATGSQTPTSKSVVVRLERRRT